MARIVDKNTPFSNNAPDIGLLTNNTGRTAAALTAAGPVADVGASFNQTTINQNFAELTARINALIADYNRNA